MVSNTATQKILDGKRDEIWKTFSDILSEGSAKCRHEILTSKEILTARDKKITFLFHWISLHEPLEGLMTPLYSDIEKVAAAQGSFVPTDGWLYHTGWHLLEEIVVSKCGKKIQDAWIEAVFSPDVRCGWNTLREMCESTDPDLRAVADANLKMIERVRQEFRKPLTTLSSAPASVEVELSSTFGPEGAEQVRPAPAILREQPASPGDNIAGDREPALSLRALYDRRGRRDVIPELFQCLSQEIDDAWAALRQGATREEIRKQFRLLGELKPSEFNDFLDHSLDHDARTWAAEIIRHRTGLEISTIKKYGQPGYRRR